MTDASSVKESAEDKMPLSTSTPISVLQLRTFAITFVTYAIFHIARKSFGSIKGELGKEEWMVSSLSSQSTMYGLMDMVFMACYAIGLYISGVLGDRLDLRKFLTSGMVCVGLVLVAFGAAGLGDIHNFTLYLFLWALNGLMQSCGWPSNIAIMSRWFGSGERGVIMGMWGCCSSLGNVAGGALVGILFAIAEPTLAWKLVMMTVGGLMILQALVVFIYLVPTPPVKHIEGEGIDKEELHAAADDEKQPQLEVISFWKAWTIPGVFAYAIAYACLKSVTYSLFFWVPYYLTANRHMSNSKANLYSVIYDVGGIAGGIIGGYVTDRMGVRSPYIVCCMCLSGPIVYCFYGASESLTGLLLFLMGLTMGGSEMLIGTSVSADLGTHPSLAANSQALATVTGIIDGTGSAGAAFTQYLVGNVANCRSICPIGGICSTECAWDSVFMLLFFALVVGVLCLSRLAFQDLKEWRRRRAEYLVSQPHVPVAADEATETETADEGPDTPGSTRVATSVMDET
ncbi:hypothetical protein AC1031_009497 [Aphanomyces cochlioides]|nr:hypothetical protein AC1031_009497 [Aphanomyces cochlioides]